jgi:hypothetical protein
VPPAILWQHSVKEVARRTAKGLACDDPTRADMRSSSEVPFGQEMRGGEWPWDETVKVPIEQAGLVFVGRIDRLDMRASGDGAQITNYKSIKPPPKSQHITLGQGRELQRVLYEMAVRILLPEIRTIVTRLIYLADEPARFESKGDELDAAVAKASAYPIAAVQILRSGRIALRSEQNAVYDDMRLGLPADREAIRRKATDSVQPARNLASSGIRPNKAYRLGQSPSRDDRLHFDLAGRGRRQNEENLADGRSRRHDAGECLLPCGYCRNHLHRARRKPACAPHQGDRGPASRR